MAYGEVHPEPWDPEVESPATIAILGAGPIGIETALYARFLGYYVEILDAHKVASRPLRWGNRSLEQPFASCSSSLGRAALLAQNPNVQLPDPDCILTGAEFAERYVIPLAKTDLLHEFVHIQSRVVSVSRYHSHRSDPIGGQDRCNDEFLVVVQSNQRGTWHLRADVVVDCTGHANDGIGLGPGGGVAVGQAEHGNKIQWKIPRLTGLDRSVHAGQHTVLWGDSREALETASDFLELFAHHSGTRLTWITPDRGDDAWSQARMASVSTLSARLSQRSDRFATYRCLGMEKLEWVEPSSHGGPKDEGWKLHVLLPDHTSAVVTAHLLITLPDPQPDWSWATALRVCEPCYMGSTTLHEPLAGSIDSPFWEVATREPHYYCLGSKRWADRRLANWPAMQDQIRKLFALLGGRHDLDLYRQFQS
jgi:hypothetical protein